MFIKLTTTYDRAIWVNVDRISAVEGTEDGSMLMGDAAINNMIVQETPAKIIDMIRREKEAWQS